MRRSIASSISSATGCWDRLKPRVARILDDRMMTGGAQTDVLLQKRDRIAVICAFAGKHLQQVARAHRSSIRIRKITSHANHRAWEKVPDRQLRQRRRLLLHVGRIFGLVFLFVFLRKVAW